MASTSKQSLFALALTAALLSPMPAISQGKESAEAFLKRYFQTLHTVKSIEELMVFYPEPSEKEKKQKEEFDNAPPEMKKMIEQLALGMSKQEPRTVKILSQTEKDGKVYFTLAPDEIPADFKKYASDPKFSMKGAVSLVNEKGQWKVYKDYWKVKTYEQGDMKLSFGRDPEGEEKDPAENMQTPAKSFDDNFRHVFTRDWKATGKGSVQTTFKLENGTLTEIKLQTKEKNQPSQEEFIKNLLSTRTIPSVPKDMEDKPYGWMQFDWTDNSYCVNGPFFGSEPQKMMQ